MTIHYFVVEQTATGKRTDSEPAMEKVNAFSAQRYIIDDTDTAMNYRIAQLARGNSKTATLGHFEFILWHRQWIKNKNVDDSLLNLLPDAEIIFLPRLVGHVSKETGNHFILWVLDFSKKEIRVYDSLKTMTSIDKDDIDLLRNVFRKRGGLKDWRETYPVQWLQKDSVNCGIFVCSATENEVNKIDVQEEGLTMTQCRILRRFHGAEMIKNVDEAAFPPTNEELEKIKGEETRLQKKEENEVDSNCHCIAWPIKACIYQRIVGSNKFLHENIKNYQWLQCKNCNKWIHFHCAGVIGEWTERDFDCGCNKAPQTNVKSSLDSTEVDSILTDQEVQTAQMMNRLQTILSVPGTETEQHMYLEEVMLPEEDKKVDTRLAHILLAAQWCKTKVFKGTVTEPEVLEMDNEEQRRAVEELKKDSGDENLSSARELFLFTFQYHSDFDMFCEEFVDKGYKVDACFEERD
ncbi:hypothetical protein ABVT39_009648 [Epinephelus coioides]